MAKKVYGHDQGGEYGEQSRVVRMPSKAKHKGYDYVDPQAGRIAKAAAGKVADGIARIVFGPKKK